MSRADGFETSLAAGRKAAGALAVPHGDEFRLLVGPGDPVSPLSRPGGFTRATAPLETDVLGHTGHMPMLERPDAFDAEAGRFLDVLGD